MSYESHTGEGLQRHVDKCGDCSCLERTGHTMFCQTCEHPWHEGVCEWDLGDVEDERYKGGMVALGPCQCHECETMTPEQVWDEINRHARDEDEAAYDRAMDQKLSEWRERER